MLSPQQLIEEATIVIPTIQLGKLSLGGAKPLAHKWQSWNLNPGGISADPKELKPLFSPTTNWTLVHSQFSLLAFKGLLFMSNFV